MVFFLNPETKRLFAPSALSGKQYSPLCSYQLVGIFMAVYIRSEHVPHVQHLYQHFERDGFVGLGNKGAIAVSIKLYDQLLCFVNVHLPAHEHKLDERNHSLNSILDTTTFGDHDKSASESGSIIHFVFNNQKHTNNVQKNNHRRQQIPFISSSSSFIPLKQHDHIFLLGDFNYRIAPQGEMNMIDVIERVEQNRYSILRVFDQLLNEMKRGKILKGWIEAELNFAPTYKYIPNSNQYHCKKGRIPSWTDRILYCSKQPQAIQQVHYGRVEALLSDHKPVSAVYMLSMGCNNDDHNEGASSLNNHNYNQYYNQPITSNQPPQRRLPPPPPSQLIRKSIEIQQATFAPPALPLTSSLRYRNDSSLNPLQQQVVPQPASPQLPSSSPQLPSRIPQKPLPLPIIVTPPQKPLPPTPKSMNNNDHNLLLLDFSDVVSVTGCEYPMVQQDQSNKNVRPVSFEISSPSTRAPLSSLRQQQQQQHLSLPNHSKPQESSSLIDWLFVTQNTNIQQQERSSVNKNNQEQQHSVKELRERFQYM